MDVQYWRQKVHGNPQGNRYKYGFKHLPLNQIIKQLSNTRSPPEYLYTRLLFCLLSWALVDAEYYAQESPCNQLFSHLCSCLTPSWDPFQISITPWNPQQHALQFHQQEELFRRLHGLPPYWPAENPQHQRSPKVGQIPRQWQPEVRKDLYLNMKMFKQCAG